VSAAHRKRLRPGELDGLVLSYLCQHKQDGPLTATAVAKGLGGRSAGAVSNCLARLAKAQEGPAGEKSSLCLRRQGGKGALRAGRPGKGAGHLWPFLGSIR
jgi:hypothetical protein